MSDGDHFSGRGDPPTRAERQMQEAIRRQNEERQYVEDLKAKLEDITQKAGVLTNRNMELEEECDAAAVVAGNALAEVARQAERIAALESEIRELRDELVSAEVGECEALEHLGRLSDRLGEECDGCDREAWREVRAWRRRWAALREWTATRWAPISIEFLERLERDAPGGE